ncbi:MAG TPA: peptidyl-prolyl cis-trans isomerase, partial [Candidatus Acidoferrales bacterium]|nr:peptidyl-prolyl cis-trans isomerase [Candidatus Acidoferrales bacterium]
KVKIEYLNIKPADVESKVSVSEAELNSFFDKNKSRYQIPEKRGFKFALLDLAKLRETVHPTEESLQAYYKENLDQYRVQFRVRVEQILFKTTGKTDAEVEETRKKAEDVLAKAKKGAKFEDLAKQYSQDDGTKNKGGDMGWIVRGQAVGLGDFEQTAFALKPGEVSGLVKSMMGFHIIKVVEREEARTKTFEEVRTSIVPILAAQAAEAKASEVVDRMAAAVRQSNKTAVEDIAKQFNLETGTVSPVAATDPMGALGVSNDVRDYVFSAQQGEDSSPLHVERGTAIVSVTQIQTARPATLAEVRGKVEADYRSEQSTTLAKQRADELYKRVQGGETLAAAAKALGFDVQTSDFLTQNDSLGGLTPMRKLAAAFTLPVGQTAAPLSQGANWLIYRPVERQEPNPDDLAKQKADIERQLVFSKQQIAFDAFQESLKQRMIRDGKLKINETVLRRLQAAS